MYKQVSLPLPLSRQQQFDRRSSPENSYFLIALPLGAESGSVDRTKQNDRGSLSFCFSLLHNVV